MDVIYTKQKEYDPGLLFLIGISCYVVILCAATLAQSETLKGMANAFAVTLFLVTVAITALMRRESRSLAGYCMALCIYYSALIASVIVNHTHLEFSDLMKFGITPAFFLIGGTFEANRSSWLWKKKEVRLLFWLLALLPLITLLLQHIMYGAVIDAQAELSMGGGGEMGFSIFANRNNAALYAVILLALFNVLAGRPIRNVFFIFAMCSAFGTLGVLIAAILAITISVGGLRAMTAIGLICIVVGITYVYAPELPGLSRIKPVISSIVLLYDGTIDLHTVTYGQLVELLNTTDLSFLFRLKHWLNLIELYRASSAYEWLFGLGMGSSVRLSTMSLVPHNDYLRFLFEFGLLGLLGFACIIGTILYACGRQWESVPLLIVVFYFFSENLVNNFLAMTIFYFCAGSLATRLAESRNA